MPAEGGALLARHLENAGEVAGGRRIVRALAQLRQDFFAGHALTGAESAGLPTSPTRPTGLVVGAGNGSWGAKDSGDQNDLDIADVRPGRPGSDEIAEAIEKSISIVVS